MGKTADIIPLLIADIYELAGQFRAWGETVAAAAGQSQARWQVLSAASGAALTVPQIARRLGVTRQAVQRVADLLVADGLARLTDNPDHKTSPHLLLTEEGRGVLDRLTQGARGGHETLAAMLHGFDLAALHRDLRTLLVTLNGSATFDGGA
jgi:DNA-binding MarR family transcriptional regulator